MNEETILITGSSGFIGRKLAVALSKDFHIIGLDKSGPEEDLPGITHMDIDITSKENIQNVMKSVLEKYGPRIHSVIHLVAFYDFDGKEDERYQTITIDGTKRLLHELRKMFHVGRFIFSSSLLVYRPVKIGDKIKDESPLAPSWPYPKSKVLAENIILQEHGEIPITVLRIAGVYEDTCHSPTISRQIQRIFEGQFTSLLFPGDTKAGQTFLHLEDLKDAIVLLVKNKKRLTNYETFILGEETVLSFEQLQAKLGMLLHKRPWPSIRVPAFVAKSGAIMLDHLPIVRKPFIKPWMIKHADDHFDVDISKIKKLLDWQPTRTLAGTLPRMIDYLKSNPKGFYHTNKIERPFYRNLDLIGKEGERNYFMSSVLNIFLGLLLLSNPFSFGEVSGGELVSQVVSGFLVTAFATLSIIPTTRWVRWINATIGMWLLFSPLVFFSTSAAAYSNDTLIGGLIILASTYTPAASQELGTPPGWTYNPSTAGQRIPIMLLAFLGFLFSRYLTSFQLGHIDEVWDPFFGSGTATVLTSNVSKAFPISDAGLGALTYLLDVIAACIGGRDRWKSLPWAVIFFGFMIIPSGIVSITLIMLQPISVGAWCTICLVTAFIMLVMVPPAIDEVLASVQFLKRRVKAGDSFWKIFWLGGEEAEDVQVQPVKHEGNLVHLYLSLLLSLWLMFTPWLLEISGIAAISTYIVASLVITFSIIAMSEVARLARLINIPLGLWLTLSGWLLSGMSERAAWNCFALGLLFIILNIPRGKRNEAYGEIDKIIHWDAIKR